MESQGKDESDEFVFVGGSMTGTIHAGEWPFGPYLFIDVPGNIPTIKTVRRTTAEFQLNAFVGWSAIRNKKHELQLRAGILGRLQSAQNHNGFGVQSINSADHKSVLYFNYRGSKRTYSFGYATEMGYNYTFINHYSLGVNLGLQNDQQGDVIIYYGIVLGRRF